MSTDAPTPPATAGPGPSGDAAAAGAATTTADASPGVDARAPLDPQAQRQWKASFQAKVAGFMMMLMGGFLIALFGGALLSLDDPATGIGAQPGGILDLEVPGHAGDTVRYVCDCAEALTSEAVLDAAGRAQLAFPRAAGTVHLLQANASIWSQPAFVPANLTIPATMGVTPGGSSDDWLGFDLDVLRNVVIGGILVVLVIIAGGFCAFRLRGPRIAMAGAIVFVLASVAAVLWLGSSLMTLGFVATSAVSAWFIYKARHEFRPWRRAAA